MAAYRVPLHRRGWEAFLTRRDSALGEKDRDCSSRLRIYYRGPFYKGGCLEENVVTGKSDTSNGG